MFCRKTEMCGCFEDQCFTNTEPAIMEEPTSDSSIFKVPKSIRKINEETYTPQLVSKVPVYSGEGEKADIYACQLISAGPIYDLVKKEKTYTPQLVSIGPYHYDKKELCMEEEKRRYKKSFFQRIGIEKKKEILSYIRDNEGRICALFPESTYQIEKCEFESMILHDAIFIIELFVRNYEECSDSMLRVPATKSSLSVDLQLLENQLPFTVIEDIYKLSIASPTLMDLAYNFFSSTDISFCSLPDPTVKIKHFTDFRRSVMLNGYENCCMKRTGKIVDLPSAAKLRRSGVKFKRSEEKCLPNIRFKKRLFPSLNCELQIPNLVLYENTEKLLLNVMALEQRVYPDDALVSSYIELINSLINTKKDVDLLVDEEIISNFLGDFASVANMFNRLSLHIRTTDSIYHGICEDLKKHYKNPWNHAKASLKRVFCDIVKGTGAAGLIFITLFTLIQTITGIIQASR